LETGRFNRKPGGNMKMSDDTTTCLSLDSPVIATCPGMLVIYRGKKHIDVVDEDGWSSGYIIHITKSKKFLIVKVPTINNDWRTIKVSLRKYGWRTFGNHLAILENSPTAIADGKKEWNKTQEEYRIIRCRRRIQGIQGKINHLNIQLKQLYQQLDSLIQKGGFKCLGYKY